MFVRAWCINLDDRAKTRNRALFLQQPTTLAALGGFWDFEPGGVEKFSLFDVFIIIFVFQIRCVFVINVVAKLFFFSQNFRLSSSKVR
jgi:hypothetical protein